MNRLAVYSYLTRYTHGHARYGTLFTDLCQKRAKNPSEDETALTHPAMTSFPADGDKDAYGDRELLGICSDNSGTRHDLLHKI